MTRIVVATVLAQSLVGVSASTRFLEATSRAHVSINKSGAERRLDSNDGCTACDLNNNIGGDGVIVRQVFDGETTNLVSASYWRRCTNDPPGVCTPTPMYQAGASGWGGNLDENPNFFDTPVLGAIIDNYEVIRDKLDFFCENGGFGTCVYYPADCNLDYRRYGDKPAPDEDGKGCHTQCQIEIDPTCDWDQSNWRGGDQTWAINTDGGCHCDTHFDANSFVESWAASDTKGDIQALDRAMCWYEHGDAIAGASDGISSALLVQLALWQNQDWRSYTCPRIGDRNPDRYYTGWNEVPLKRDVVNNPANWRALIINLPIDMETEDIATDNDNGDYFAMDRLTADIYFYNKAMYSQYSVSLDGFPVVFAYGKKVDDSSGNYDRVFYCKDWTSADTCWSVVDENGDWGQSGPCYFRWNC